MEAYELNGHRYRELKHFCLQYDYIRTELSKLESGCKNSGKDPTGDTATKIAQYKNALKLIETTAYDTDRILGDKVLEIVTEDVDIYATTMPCSRECLEELRRRFYWLLDKRKGV